VGHFFVVCGVNTDTGMFYRDNPPGGYDKNWEKLSYFKLAWSSGRNIGRYSAVALKSISKDKLQA